MSHVGKKILEQRENDMSITSGNCTTHKSWEVILDEGDTVVAELKSTNKFMYSGSGSFERFTKDEINTSGVHYSRKLID